ncbi:SURF1 family cytochrome oxidase biogenesis protein [Microbacterium sp.]|uniref:SURF1 family cytochrome oxidase biogenesis protein n=1 Tax=Microbacterium sp. TaxID=51671 RepID=UPI0028121471|nr:SURF1 family cytochrome oxidase biogenesis protein [Microbacterium sp.]
MTTEPAPEGLDFPPTLREVMLRPRWLLMLAFALLVAGVFAWLGQWQLSSAIDTDPVPEGATEEIRPIEDVVEPGQYLEEPLVGQRVEVAGGWIPGDFIVVSSRYNDGAQGFWVTGQFRVDAERPTALAVAVGWAPTRERADAAVETLNRLASTVLREGAQADPLVLTGRIISDEGPALPPGADPLELTRMSPAALLSRWHERDGSPIAAIDVYRPYLTSADPTGALGDAGLDAISSPAPELASPINWLNIFYAVEWAVFAGFAFYLWYRLAKDAWERELEERDGPVDPDED